MFKFAVAVDGPLITAPCVQAALGERLPRPNELEVKEFKAPREMYLDEHELADRASKMVGILYNNIPAKIYVAIVSGFLATRTGLSPLRYDFALVMEQDGTTTGYHLNDGSLVLHHCSEKPMVPLESLFRLKRLIAGECKKLKKASRALKSP